MKILNTFLLIVTFIFSLIQNIDANEPIFLPKPGIRVALSPTYNPPMLKGIKVDPNRPFHFDFILDPGDSDAGDSNVGNRQAYSIQDESTKLIKYFLASLTTPEKDLWVNLSPYEKHRIIPESFGQTEMGRDLLAQDYVLKQITASLMYPEEEFGKQFWAKIYAEAAKKFGTTQVPVNTFNKVWIVPEKAVVFENKGTAYVVESRLKVMLEEDYLASKKNNVETQNLASLSKQIIQEIIIPALTKEVNEGNNFAQLRQVYSSLILATWYKSAIGGSASGGKNSILSQVYTNKNKTKGLEYADSTNIENIYAQYLVAFKKGVFNYISAGGGSASGGKEDQDPATGKSLPRKYFSGGVLLNPTVAMVITVKPNSAMQAANEKKYQGVSVELSPAMTVKELVDRFKEVSLACGKGISNFAKKHPTTIIAAIVLGLMVFNLPRDGGVSRTLEKFDYDEKKGLYVSSLVGTNQAPKLKDKPVIEDQDNTPSPFKDIDLKLPSQEFLNEMINVYKNMVISDVKPDLPAMINHVAKMERVFKKYFIERSIPFSLASMFYLFDQINEINDANVLANGQRIIVAPSRVEVIGLGLFGVYEVTSVEKGTYYLKVPKDSSSLWTASKDIIGARLFIIPDNVSLEQERSRSSLRGISAELRNNKANPNPTPQDLVRRAFLTAVLHIHERINPETDDQILKKLIAYQRSQIEIAQRFATVFLPKDYNFEQYNRFLEKLFASANVADRRSILAKMIDGQQDPLRLMIEMIDAPETIWQVLMALWLEIPPYNTWIKNFDVASPTARARLFEEMGKYKVLAPEFYILMVNEMNKISELIKTPEGMRVVIARLRVQGILVAHFLDTDLKYKTSSVEKPPSKAMTATGGIDLTSDRLDVDVRNGGEAVALNVDQAQMADMDLNGLSAQIMEIKPVNLAAFLGVSLLDASPKPR